MFIGRLRPVRLAFFGTPPFAVPSLAALIDSRHQVELVVAQPDRPAGRGMNLRRPPVAELALESGIPLLQPERARDERFIEEFASAGVEIAAVVAYGKILPASLLAVPPLGFVNVHGSVLPKYRGAAPIQRAIENGEAATGVTIMQLDEQMDHGPVFATEEIAIGRDEHTPELAERLARAGGKLLIEVLDAIERGEAVAREQDHESATYAPKIEREEGMVRWDQPASRLYDRYRAFDPWPGLTAKIAGESVRLVEIEPASSLGGRPGEIEAVDGESALVACGSGALRIRRMQRPGKRPVAAADLLRGWGIVPGGELA
jgi:methionyl-tRNA formyltransferase